MKIRIYNTLTRGKSIFEPIDEKNVRLYVCGPTVYGFPHLGNARPVIIFDVLFRLMRYIYGSNHVTYVRNITDIDDKINADAAVKFPHLPLNQAIRQFTRKTATQYQNDMKQLGCLDPTHQPRATDFILPRTDEKFDMVSMIRQLIDRNHAYIAHGKEGREILFRINSMVDYGSLSKRSLKEQKAGIRIPVESHKENPFDFVLWKESTEKEPGWTATFGCEEIRGRPGWHIECSAMTCAYLGKVFDIHGGGLDLMFPHHENELAQSRCCFGTKVMANVWMHNSLLRVDGKKMSKSLGNFHTVHEILSTPKIGGRYWPGAVIRLAMLMTHYREPIDFNLNRLQEAENILTKIMRRVSGHQREILDQLFLDDLANDLNTTTYLKRMLSQNIRPGMLYAAAEFIGLNLSKSNTDIDIKRIIQIRLNLIAKKKWVKADRIRDYLLDRGIKLKDSKDSENGERITKWEIN
ncbi:cysteine--tRNA ligase [Candidatus Endowatersipora endosymbiont of Watersipora subatra]|uniref:cysteine--tRNA ligase n=1 Tax=Candidatus Endowatersipora endosymbiont of Watersipora subatra TaxID=3077946 RepID=UPI00312C74A4